MIQEHSFHNTSLKQVTYNEFPNVKYINSYAFHDYGHNYNGVYYNGTIEKVDLPKLISVGSYAFSGQSGQSKMTSFNAPNINSISDYMFQNCTNLTDLSIGTLSSISSHGFHGCSKLKNLTSLESLTYMGAYAFAYCSSLSELSLPNLTTLGQYVFEYCSSLNKIDTSKITTINSNVFYNCINLRAVILRNTSRATLSNINAFNNTPVASGDGYIYVPKSLVSSYQTASNWSVFSSKFRAIEDYPEICN